MPDLKSELKKLEALEFDDSGNIHNLEAAASASAADTIGKGVSATVFDVIRDNPGCSRKLIVAKAAALGVGGGSSSTLIAQFVKRGLIRSSSAAGGDTVYFATADRYKKGYVKQAPRPSTRKEKKTAPVAQKSSSVQSLLEGMSVVKARALYDELRKIFGG